MECGEGVTQRGNPSTQDCGVRNHKGRLHTPASHRPDLHRQLRRKRAGWRRQNHRGEPTLATTPPSFEGSAGGSPSALSAQPPAPSSARSPGSSAAKARPRWPMRALVALSISAKVRPSSGTRNTGS